FLLFVLLPSFFLRLSPPPLSSLFPYTTLFRSLDDGRVRTDLCGHAHRRHGRRPPGGPCGSDCRSAAGDRRGRPRGGARRRTRGRSEEHTSELQSRVDLVCRLLLEKKTRNILYE